MASGMGTKYAPSATYTIKLTVPLRYGLGRFYGDLACYSLPLLL